MKRILLSGLTAILLIFIAFGNAKAQSPVKWTANVKMDSPTTGVVYLTGQIEDGWHIYGTKMPEDGPNPTQIFFSQSGIAFEGSVKVSPAPKKEFDQMFEAELTYWEGKVVFTRKFTVKDPTDPTIFITVKYMCCNDSMCRPPVSEKLTVKINN